MAHAQQVGEQFRFIREATPAELEQEIQEVKGTLDTLVKKAGRAIRTPVTEALNNYLHLLRQARAVS